MTATGGMSSKSSGKRPLAGAMAVCVLAFGASGYGQLIEFVPVSSTGPAIINGNEIIISSGGVQIQFDVMISGWGDAPFSPPLGSFQGTFDASGLLGANAVPPNAGLDLGYPTPVPCSTDGDCPSGLCGRFKPLFCDDSLPAFQLRTVCLDDSSVPCVGGNACPGTPVCIGNADFALLGCGGGVAAIGLPPSGNFWWWAACASGETDPGFPRLAGSLRIDVPPGARGTYTLSFISDPEQTLFNDDNGVIISGLSLVSGLVTVELGCCCYGIGSPIEDCIEDMTEQECFAEPAPRFWESGIGNCNSPRGCCCFSDPGTPQQCSDNVFEFACPWQFNPDFSWYGEVSSCPPNDLCPNDPFKSAPGICGCGVADQGDQDGDGFLDCIDRCPGISDALYAPSCVISIPTVSVWGIVILTLMLLLLVAGNVYFSVKSPPAT